MRKTLGTGSLKKKKSSKRAFLLSLVFFVVSLLFVSSLATQYLAGVFKYHSSLSGHVFGKFYWPWSWAEWAINWWSVSPDLLKKALTIFLVGSLFVLLVTVLGLMRFFRRAKAVEGLHGTAHWADREDIKKGGLLTEDGQGEGVYVGAWKDEQNNKVHYLRHNGPEHILAFAPTRSGKGVGLVLPTLLSWKESVVCYDLKGENWALTSGWRKSYAGHTVMKFDPVKSDGRSACFNPLEEIRLGQDQEVGDVQNLAYMLVDPEGKGLADHWAKTSHALLSGVILHCCYEKQAVEKRCATLHDVVTLLSDPDKPVKEVLEDMLAYKHIRGETHPLVAQEARAMLNKDQREFSSVVSTALSFLTLYRDPVIASNTHHSDFRIQDLMNHETPVSLYLVARSGDADRLRPLMRLLLTQIVRKLTEHMEFEDGQSARHYKHRLLLLLDEFPSLKYMPVIEEGLAFMAGYGLKAYLIIQNMEQLTRAYTKEENIVGNCHIRVAYAPNKLETAEVLSRMSGQTTVVKKQTSVSGKRFSLMLGQVSESMQEVQRPLITADEVMRLKAPVKDKDGKILEAGDMLIFSAGYPPVYGQQILYFQDPYFQKRAEVPAVRNSDHILSPSPVKQREKFQLD